MEAARLGLRGRLGMEGYLMKPLSRDRVNGIIDLARLNKNGEVCLSAKELLNLATEVADRRDKALRAAQKLHMIRGGRRKS